MKPREYTEAGMSMPTNGLPGPTMAEGICWERSDSRSGYRRRRVLTTRQEVQTTWQETRDLLFSTTQATEKKKQQCLRRSSKTECKMNTVRLKTGKLGKK